MRIIGYTSKTVGNKVLVTESTGEQCLSDNPSELLTFLAEPFESEDVIKAVWDLADFVAPILKLLPHFVVKHLADSKGSKFENVFLYYIPSKVFSLKVQGWPNRVRFYELVQYYPDYPDPDDALNVAAYGTDLLGQLKKVGIYLQGGDRLTSPAAVFEDKILRHVSLPSFKDAPEGLNSYAYACCGRLWISALQIGRWQQGKVWDYDINSAFAYQASQLFDFRHAKIEHSDTLVKGAHWGFLRGYVSIDSPVSPIMYETEDGSLANPVGEWEGCITLDEARFITKNKLGKFKLLDGWFITFVAPVKPLESIVNRLYAQRQRTNPTLDLFLKRGVNGAFYGKFIERFSETEVGDFFCPAYAAMISTRARLQVGQFILDNNLADDLLHVSVDGLLATKKVAVPDTRDIGTWRVSEPDGVIIASSGQVFKKAASGKSSKPKGITYDAFMGMVKEHPLLTRYEVKVPRRVSLLEAANGRWGELGAVRNFSSSIDFVTAEHNDRHFKKLPKNGKGLLTKKYTSTTIHIQKGA